ncbi:MAG: hypothetical protein KKA73_11610 [Chloroflexi bacterium]|nr:hypothetical protein [Chloroflexota bacterium]MBU1748325.1 hypothetical protein [Chloroflexota bacterium]
MLPNFAWLFIVLLVAGLSALLLRQWRRPRWRPGPPRLAHRGWHPRPPRRRW